MGAGYERFRSGSVLNFDKDVKAVTETSSRLLTRCRSSRSVASGQGRRARRAARGVRRTVRRDIERLQALGYPVESLTGPAGGYRLRAGTAMPPLLLDDDEAIAIAVGLRTAARASVRGIEETSVLPSPRSRAAR